MALGVPPLRPVRWQRLDCDLRPWLERAPLTAWEKGCLPDSRDPADYRVAHLNFAWEMPGLNRVAMEVRALSLRANIRNPFPAEPGAPHIQQVVSGGWRAVPFRLADAGFAGRQNGGADFRFCNLGDDLCVRAVTVRRRP